MATRLVWDAESSIPPATNAGDITTLSTPVRRVLWLDGGTQEGRYFEGIAPQGLTGTLTMVIYYLMASATTGGIRLQASVEAVTPGDAFDLDAGNSFDTANGASDTTVPSTAGYMEAVSITLTTNDSMAAGDIIRIFVERVTGHADDNASGDLGIYKIEFRDAA